ncbi:MAG: SoxR reducing system RseC family protein [Anaerolineae bacterium]|nr:SoxR reducing system RseC family protein [Anaerolineae bacterium]MCO5192168.1 SoxR reducing system RseC family protein [Anaerolineae bacterium]
MEFEEMQAIWDSQNEEKLYAINEAALHEQIRRKGRSVERKVDILEGIMMGVNLLVAIVLTVDAVIDGEPLRFYLIPAAYFAYFIVGLVWRMRRSRAQVQFEPTMVGDLDKAIWQIDYLIRQTRAMLIWYLIPLLVFIILVLGWGNGSLWAALLALVVIPLAYFGGRWEVNKFYLPKKRSLESLRATLLEAETM